MPAPAAFRALLDRRDELERVHDQACEIYAEDKHSPTRYRACVEAYAALEQVDAQIETECAAEKAAEKAQEGNQ